MAIEELNSKRLDKESKQNELEHREKIQQEVEARAQIRYEEEAENAKREERKSLYYHRRKRSWRSLLQSRSKQNYLIYKYRHFKEVIWTGCGSGAYLKPKLIKRQ